MALNSANEDLKVELEKAKEIKAREIEAMKGQIASLNETLIEIRKRPPVDFMFRDIPRSETEEDRRRNEADDEQSQREALHDRAILIMHDTGKGILSPYRYHEKQMTWMWMSAAIGACIGFIFSKWLSLGHIGVGISSMVCVVLGFFIGGFVFEASYVEDESLEAPLFGKSKCPKR